MNLKRCESGKHYYDGDKYSSCPHCKAEAGAASASEDSVTMSYDTMDASSQGMPTMKDVSEPTMNESSRTADAGANPKVHLSNAPTTPMYNTVDDDSTKTVRFYEADMSIEPVVGWLVALSGNEKGKSYMLKAGPNFIGRDSSMDVTIAEDKTVSRNKHAVMIYDPKSRRFFALPGESKALFYVDDEVVLNNVEVKDRQIITVGETQLMLVPFCNSTFAWEDIKEDENE